MKYTLFAFLLCFGVYTTGFAQKPEKAPKPPKEKKKKKDKSSTAQPAAFSLKTNQDSIGYAIGMDIGNNLKKQGIEVSMEALFKGMEDAYGSKPTQLSDEQVRMLMTAWQQSMQKKQQEAKQAIAMENKKKGEEFLAKNKTKPGVITLPSGLQYEVIKEGTGRQPLATDKVTTHYHGTLIDGTVFDSSVNRGEPATFPVNGVIQAWQIILPMMKEGGKVRIYSPSDLAYGASGQGAVIGPNAVLIFEIELIKVQ